jgi:cytochrome c oxidase subunit 3
MLNPPDGAAKDLEKSVETKVSTAIASVRHETQPEMHKVGMICFLISEVAFFSTLITAYVVFLAQEGTSPTPREALALPLVIVNTICLLASSYTVHHAEKTMHRGSRTGFLIWWAVTIVLGVWFLVGTGIEWRSLINDHGLTISRNIFGTSYYTLVGFHAFHVTLGVIALISILGLAVSGNLRSPNSLPVTLVGWYWHFVDGVWVVVFAVVYIFGR